MPVLPAFLQHDLPDIFAVSSDVLHTLSSAAQRRALSDTINPNKLLTQSQSHWVQVTVCLCSSISLVGSVVSVYWFSKMNHKFRHKLIMLLISADFLRSIWLFTFTIVSFSRGLVQTKDTFCQASGYFLQLSYGMADYSALAIAVHTALQVFKPTILGITKNETGLYRYRIPISIAVVLFPATLCALAFTRHGPAFIAQGPLCSLPLRPFWYRLAIGWIPRYLIMLTVLILYICLYIHVGRQFGSFQNPSKSGSKPKPQALFFNHNLFEMTPVGPLNGEKNDVERNDSVATSLSVIRNAMKTSERATIRRGSDGTTLVNGSTSTTSGKSGMSLLEVPKPVSHVPTTSLSEARQSIIIESPLAQDIIDRQDHAPNAVLVRDVSNSSPTNPLSLWNAEHGLQGSSEPIFTRELRAKRHHAMRQLRLLFIYPIVYFIMWLVPFVLNLTNYSDYLVQHPPYGLLVVAYISISLMGAVSALTFSIREHPWRHIAGSDGTFWGSFLFWQHDSTRRCSDNSLTDFGNASISSSVPSTSAGLGGLSAHSALGPPAQSRPPILTRNSIFSLKLASHQVTALPHGDKPRSPVSRGRSTAGIVGVESPNPTGRERDWFDLPCGRVSDDDGEEPGSSST